MRCGPPARTLAALVAAVVLLPARPAVAQDGPPPPAPDMPSSTRNEKPCGRARNDVHPTGVFIFSVWIVEGEDRYTCAQARERVAHSNLTNGIALGGGWYHWDWTKGGNRPWSDVWMGENRQVVLGAIYRGRAGGGGGGGGGGGSGGVYDGSGPRPPAGEGCETRLTIVGREVWSPCLRRDGNRWHASTWVRVGGLDYRPASGTRLTLSKAGRLDGRGRLTVRTSGKLLPDGQIELHQGDLDTDLTTQRAYSLEGSKPVTLGGLPASREAGVGLKWTQTGAELSVSLDIGADVLSLIDPSKPVDKGAPTLQNGYGLQATLVTANDTGLVLDEISASVARATAFRALALEDLSVSYKPEEKLWTGAATVIPFPAGPLAKAALGSWTGEVAIAIQPIALHKVGLSVKQLNRPLGTTGVFLQSLGGEFAAQPLLKLTGTMGVSFGPKLDIPLIGKGVSAVSADGKAELTMGPWIARGAGSMAIVKQPVANGAFTLDLSNASASVTGQVNVAILGNGFSGDLEGWIVRTAAFGLGGGAQVKILGHGFAGGEAMLSSAGMGACARITGPDFGWRLRWGDTVPKVMFSSCDIGPLEVARPAQAAQAGGFAVPAGQPGWVVRVRPAGGGQAAVALRDPAGGVTELPASQGVVQVPGLVALRDAATGELWIVLDRPRAGTWSVTPLAGAPAVAGIDQARVLRSPRVRASVSRPDRRGRRTLRWRARAIRGQRLVFTERGANGFARVIARTDRPRGSRRFGRGDTRRGARRVTVQVVQDGTPRAAFRVARFRERAQGPARPARLRVARRGARVTIRWSRARGAGAYRVAVRLSDRRRLDRTMRAGRRTLVLRGVGRRTRGRVIVRALSPAGVPGAARTGRLR